MIVFFKVGSNAPDFTAEALVGNDFVDDWTLSSLKGKYIVLFTYPLNWTFVCPTEILAFNDRLAEFKALKCEVVGLSVDSKHSHWAWTQSPRAAGGLGGPLKIPLISDLSHAISEQYGCLWDKGHTLRALYIIDAKFKIRHVTLNDDPVGRSVDETLRLVQAYQHHDSNPNEVCPIGWKKGDATIIDNHKRKTEYFAKVNKK